MEFRFYEPPRVTKIGFKKWRVQEIRESSYREVRKLEGWKNRVSIVLCSSVVPLEIILQDTKYISLEKRSAYCWSAISHLSAEYRSLFLFFKMYTHFIHTKCCRRRRGIFSVISHGVNIFNLPRVMSGYSTWTNSSYFNFLLSSRNVLFPTLCQSATKRVAKFIVAWMSRKFMSTLFFS